MIALRKRSAALKYGATITLWSDDLIYAFLRIATDDVALVIIHNGYSRTSNPIQLELNEKTLPQWVIDMMKNELKHWKTGQGLAVQGNKVAVTVEGKTIDIYCRAEA